MCHICEAIAPTTSVLSSMLANMCIKGSIFPLCLIDLVLKKGSLLKAFGILYNECRFPEV